MTITVLELMIAYDALQGSRSIADRGELFRYTRDAREAAMLKLQSILGAIVLDVSSGEESLVIGGDK